MTTIKWRRDTAAAWTLANPILAEGEAGFETNTGKAKVGNGTTAWNSLPYFGGGGERVVQTITSPTTLAAGEKGTDYVYLLSSSSGTGDQFLSNVVVLLNGNGADNSTSITDSGPLNKTVTVGGAAKISTAQSKFGGASMYFPGADADRLTLAASSDYVMGSSDFCVEGWVYRQSGSGGYSRMIHFGPTWGNNDSWGIIPGHADFSDKIVFASYKLGFTLKSAAAIVNNTWYHVAGVRSGNLVTLYVNGVAQESATVSGTIESSSTNYVTVGGTPVRFSGENFAGYIDDVRITKNARYLTNFAVPTAQLPNTSTPSTSGIPTLPTAVDNPSKYTLKNLTGATIPVGTTSNQLVNGSSVTGSGDNAYENVVSLLHFEGSGVNDSITSGPIWTPNGSVGGISTAQKKFGSSSLAGGGQGSYYYASTKNDLFSWGTGDFTIEFFAYATGNTSFFFDTTDSGNLKQAIFIENTSTLYYYANSVQAINGGTPPFNEWMHIAVCRSSGNTRMFVNGTQVGSTYSDTQNYQCPSNRPMLGNLGSSPGNVYQMKGYMDEFRATKVARYTGNFTPPTVPFPDTGNFGVFTKGSVSLISDGSNWHTI